MNLKLKDSKCWLDPRKRARAIAHENKFWPQLFPLDFARLASASHAKGGQID